MAQQILNIDMLEFKPFPAPIPDHAKEKFEGALLAFVGTQIGAQKLGYSVIKLPPGKRAFPFHNHVANEEMFFVLEGSGEVRIGDETFQIKKGDFMAHPPGGSETAHQIINTSQQELTYLAVSTKIGPEVCEYPDSKKFGVLNGPSFRFLGKKEESLGYFDGE